ncbi:RNA metabolism protein [Lithospermum erythrorhizon]|uniref:RNA metabolism protein n=1 Tax=Lithospermum erythrorhizon TaxID=34254 RepID=A0AAV3P5X5_LITER
MAGFTCNACNKELVEEDEQRLHYKSEWHRYNLKRKVAGVPGVTEALFLARQSVIAKEKTKSDETPMLYSCGVCAKNYRSSKAHAEHLKSKSHLSRASQRISNQDQDTAIVRPLPARVVKVAEKQSAQSEALDDEESEESEWEEVDSDEDLIDEATDKLTRLEVNANTPSDLMDDGSEDDEEFEVDPSSCFMCDVEHKTIEACMVHMHKHHGFFIPDVEYLKDPRGLLIYLGLKVKRDFTCLYCNDRCQPFSSLEAVRKHMEAKRHCKVHYGDGDEDEEVELEEFYDYSSSYMDVDGSQLVATNDIQNDVELGSGGSELIIRSRTTDGVSIKTLGSREFLRYYRQKPRPTAVNDVSAVLASRYRSMGLATVQSKEHMVRMKVLKAMNRSGVDIMRSKMGMKSNVIRNLPKNVTH